MSKTNVLQLGRDWWEAERPGVKGKVKVETVVKRRPIRDTRFYTVKEVAEMLRRSYHTIYLLCRSGELECQPMARGYLIPEHALEDYLHQLRMKKGAG